MMSETDQNVFEYELEISYSPSKQRFDLCIGTCTLSKVQKRFRHTVNFSITDREISHHQKVQNSAQVSSPRYNRSYA